MGNETCHRPNTLVIGIGNADRGDDAAGLMAARQLRGRAPARCSVIEHSGEGIALMEAWKGADRVIVIDAMCSGAAPGTVTRFDASHRPLPAATFRDSTHNFSLPEALELGRVLAELPAQLIVYGIEAQNFATGAMLSAIIDSALATVVKRVLQELSGKQLRSPA